ncbi:MAG: hypothetical protein PF638_08620 [Candidatus Delongbacteria bacterium]|nr:hypothetical protein [Candidatus Delongbacteria bacterium]
MIKKIIPILITICFSILNSQLINTNSDPNGEPWYAGGTSEFSRDQKKKIDSFPILTLPEIYKNRKESLPYTIDNSLLPYFRPVFNQKGGSCAQATSIAYVYTYEQNFSNETSADLIENQYPTHYTYNFLNNADPETGTQFYQGWDFAMKGGIPNVETYGGLWPSDNPDTMYKLWLNGYGKYESGMRNRSIEELSIPVGTPEGLATLKQWFNDHCNVSSAGGIVLFSAGVTDSMQIDTLSQDSYCNGEKVILRWDSYIDHSMTLVGYNDSIRWDYNNDGKYTNDIDITGDSIVDMKDWEIGGVRLVNSWGETWADSGKAWVMYRTLALHHTEGGIYLNRVYSIEVGEPVVPQLKIKAAIDYDERNDIKVKVGIAYSHSATEPEYTIEFPHFNYQGGDSIGMNGIGNIIEFGLDISPILNQILYGEDVLLFLCVEQLSGNGGMGKIISFSTIDGEGVETVSDKTNIDILPGETTYATIILQHGLAVTSSTLPEIIQEVPYSYTLSADKGTEPYNWDVLINYNEVPDPPIFTTDSLIELNMSEDNDGFVVIDLDFKFPYFNNLISSITITTNGAITFDGASYENVKTLDDVYSTKTIAPCAAEFTLGDEGGIYYFANENYVIINWKTAIPDTDIGSGSGLGTGSSTGSFDFYTKLFSDGKIEFFYGEFSDFVERVIAVSNGSQESTFISDYSNITTQSNITTSFVTNPYPAGIIVSNDGVLYGTIVPRGQTNWDILLAVTDSNDLIAVKELTLSLSGLTAPSNTLISMEQDSLSLSWEQVPGAVIYHIYRSENPYSGFVEIGTTSALYYEYYAILPERKYFYYVTAESSE